MVDVIDLEVLALHAGLRLDQFVVMAVPELSRAAVQRLLKEGHVTGNRSGLSSSLKVKEGDRFQVVFPAPTDPVPQAQIVPFDVIYEDADLLVINKPAGLVVHPAAGNPDHTLVNGLIAHCGDSLSGIGGVKRPGIVHRLDKGTSGLMVVAKHDQAHRHLTQQFQARSLYRVYEAFVWGRLFPPQGRIEGDIGRHPAHRQKMAVVTRNGKPAVTDYQVLSDLGAYAQHVRCQLGSGRTHQIRVHLSTKGHPLVGDSLYGKAVKAVPASVQTQVRSLTDEGQRPALHAGFLSFLHPRTGEVVSFTCPWPEDLESLHRFLKTL
jgi:23S rRNA pseudouridine1911/1915/1917 synthase